MEPVNVTRYARLLGLSTTATKELLLKALTNAARVLQRRITMLEKTPDGYTVLGLPYHQYRVLWVADQEELITEPAQKELVKRMHQELRDINPKPGEWHYDQVTALKSMCCQDMVRAGLWTRRHDLETNPTEEEVEDDL